MNIHIKLRGVPEKIVENAVKLGIAESKAEFIRMSIILAGRQLEPEFKEDFVKEIKDRLETEKPKETKIEQLLGD